MSNVAQTERGEQTAPVRAPAAVWGARARLIALVFGLCTVVGLFFSTQLFLIYRQFNYPEGWVTAIRSSLVSWYTWGILAFLVFGLARRFSLDGQHLWFRLLVHLTAAASVALLHTLLCVAWFWNLESRSSNEQTWWSAFQRGIVLYFHWDVLIYAAIVGFVHAFDFYRRARDRQLQATRLESQLHRARLDALRMQLNPHFLFNSLNAISELVHENPQLADQAVTQLAALLRTILDEPHAHEISLREELEFVEKYLAIEHIRFGNRLLAVVDAEPGVLDLAVPSLLLQPLIENAIHHGIAANEKTGAIRITANRCNNQLELRVWNSRSPSSISKPDASTGMGIKLVRDRLAQCYGGLARLELTADDPNGFLALVVVPVQLPVVSDVRYSDEDI